MRSTIRLKNWTTAKPNLAPYGYNLSGIGLVFPGIVESTTAHEIGHNHNLPHISCDNETNERPMPLASGTDDFYPYNSAVPGNGVSDNTSGGGDDYGRIGKVGYDFRNGNYVSKTLFHDIMSYCTRLWISDYHYNKLHSFQNSLKNTVGGGSSGLQVMPSTSISSSVGSDGYAMTVADTSNVPVNIVDGTYINGLIRENGILEIRNTLQLSKKPEILDNGPFEYILQTVSGEIFQGYFLASKADHSPVLGFSFFVKTQEQIKVLQINRTSDLKEVFREEFGPATAAKTVVSLERISDTQWKLRATNKGRRIVRRLQPTNRVLVFDFDQEDKIIKGVEGETIEIQYQPRPGRTEKLLIELR